MITTKIYNQRIDFKDVNSIYRPREKSCMLKLRDNYKGRCYKGAYIVDIQSIIKISDVEISQNHSDARASLCVVFKAQVIQREENNAIAKCKIIKRKGDRTFAETQYSNVILLNHDMLKIVKEKDIIPIIIMQNRHTILGDKISIFAKPYTPHVPNKNYIYVITDPMSKYEIHKIKTYISQIEELRKWLKKLEPANMKKFTAFDNIFYPFKKQKEPKLLENKNISVTDMFSINLESFKNSIIIISPEIKKSKLFALHANISALDSIKKLLEKNKTQNSSYSLSKYIIISEKAYIVLEIIYIKYIKYILFLRDMIKEYGFPEENNIYWKNLKEYKLH